METEDGLATTIITWDRETMRAGRRVMETLRDSAAWSAYLEQFGDAPERRLVWVQVGAHRVLVGIDSRQDVLQPPHQSTRKRARLWLTRPYRPAR